ncbi:putative pantothenate kinase subunit [Trypanosoma theileri]|uniref:Putative pantothenate kinase subunit n=1 Tax=Trypanosoma theileri TaxID=67003 RepID=A0A1X0NVL0_9TRYP|nr:putative pantothenate kinase subunit [Trypanosoma theileri]ORC88641.1 putative pantothenate kinase subunit [Trypanosoma theileri]
MHFQSLQRSEGGESREGGANNICANNNGHVYGENVEVRVLSYNFNILPRGCGGFQNERITTFLECVDQYDVLLLQEVYATSLLPYFVQKRICAKKRLLDELKQRGFSHYVISKQPSYPTIFKNNVFTDNGLIIASRFPIGQRGSYTFCSDKRSEQSVRRGCLFAEVTVPTSGKGSESILFFNVHLRPEESSVEASAQVMETRRFVDSVLGHLNASQEDGNHLPFVLAGDLNINGIDLHHVGQTTKKLNDFMNEFQTLGGGITEVIFDTYGYHPPTRPTKLFFPTQSKLNRNSLTPQRQDYFFVNPTVKVSAARIQKFVTSSERPYVYLSDHFGVSAVLNIPVTGRVVHQSTLTRRQLNLAVAGETVHEHSNPFSSTKMEVIPLFLLACVPMYFNYWVLLGLASLWMLLWWFSSQIRVLGNERKFAIVTDDVVKGKDSIKLLHPREYDILQGANSIADLWQRAVQRHKTLRCLGQQNDVGDPVWLTYATVDAQARELGSGLCALGAMPGDVIGVGCQASVKSVILEIACAMYGFTTLPLVGKSTTFRTLIDEHKIKIAFASRGAVGSLLTCRSRSLETIIHMYPFSDATDSAMARDVDISLIPYDEVCHKGRLHVVPTSLCVDGDSVFSLVVDTVTSGETLKTIRITHAEVLHNIRTLVATSVLPSPGKKHIMVQFTPFGVFFNRIFILGLFAHGSCVATSEVASRDVFATFRPTIMLANPSLFDTSAIELKRANERYGRIYSCLFDMVYQLRSVLINVHYRDSAFLRFLFFRSIRRQFGGNVEKIVMCTSEESLPYRLEEHITVCFAPCLREVFFLPSEGVFCVDGIPAPNVRVTLEAFDEPSKKAKIGQLTLTREDGKSHTLPIAAKWDDDRTLRLMGATNGVLLPVKCEYVVAAELERILAQSRYVSDIFLYARPSQPIIAVVTPNRDTVEFEWQHQYKKQQQLQEEKEVDNYKKSNMKNNGINLYDSEGIPLSWTDLSRYASDLLLADFRSIIKANHLHESYVPQFVHLHPHPFRDHGNFLTPYAEIQRNSLVLYFKSVFDRLYSDSESTVLPPPCCGITSDDDTSTNGASGNSLPFRVPVAIDIGGTFAKMLYVQPPGSYKLPDYLVHEASSLSKTLGMRIFNFFKNPKDAEKELSENPSSMVGTVRFAKVPSKRIPELAAYLGDIKFLDLYKQSYHDHVRATGGGAFKFSSLAKKRLQTTFEVMREMDAVVQGLGLVIREAPESIFTVDPPTGTHHAHKLWSPPGDVFLPYPCLLVNIGSGISIIKVHGPDGSHVRVGGSPIGGATFWGLVRTMTDVTSWEEVMEIMRLDGPGDNRNVDLLVGDIYGYNAADLPAMLSVDTVASTFGKLGTERFYAAPSGPTSPNSSTKNNTNGMATATTAAAGINHNNNHNNSNNNNNSNGNGGSNHLHGESNTTVAKKKPSAIDIVRSLLNMISSNVTQLAYLHSRMQNVPNIFFAGGFVRDNPVIWSHISSTLLYWSKGECHAHFLKYDGYLGVLGSATMLSDTEVS